MLGTYKRAGYGMEMCMGWSAFLFVVAAFLFVDDSDLMHMCVDHTCVLTQTSSLQESSKRCTSGLSF